MPNNTQREAFEKWHARLCISTDPLEWDGDGYVDFDHNRAWKAWLASRSAALEEACQAIKARDDATSDEDYMLDSDDCIEVVRALANRSD